MQLPKRVVEAVGSCRLAPPRSRSVDGSRSSSDLDSTAAAAASQAEKAGVRFGGACSGPWRLLCSCSCLDLVVLVEFVVIHPRPPEREVVNLNLTRFSTSSYRPSRGTLINNLSSSNSSQIDYHGSAGDHGPIQLLTAVIVVIIRASNEIERIGTFYDHVHVRVLYNGEVVGEGLVGPFFLGRKISNLLQTQVEAQKLPVRHATGKQLLTDMHDHQVDFQVKVHVRTRVSLLKYLNHHFRVHVWCDITVDFGGVQPLISNLSRILSPNSADIKTSHSLSEVFL